MTKEAHLIRQFMIFHLLIFQFFRCNFPNHKQVVLFELQTSHHMLLAARILSGTNNWQLIFNIRTFQNQVENVLKMVYKGSP